MTLMTGSSARKLLSRFAERDALERPDTVPCAQCDEPTDVPFSSSGMATYVVCRSCHALNCLELADTARSDVFHPNGDRR